VGARAARCGRFDGVDGSSRPGRTRARAASGSAVLSRPGLDALRARDVRFRTARCPPPLAGASWLLGAVSAQPHHRSAVRRSPSYRRTAA
jgi:hypothetical protein